MHAKVRSRFRPNITWLGRMHTSTRVEVSRGVGHLCRIRIARRNETVHERRGGIAQDWLRISLRGRLGEVVILHRNYEDSSDRLRRVCVKMIWPEEKTPCVGRGGS